MRGFCEQLGRSLHEHPRRIWVIYADPAYLPVMLQYLPVHEKSRSKYGGYEFVYLENCSQVAATASQGLSET